MSPSYRNQSIDLLCKSIDWFLYEGKTGTQWVKCKGTPGKIEPSPQFFAEEKLTFQRPISTTILRHDISDSIVLNTDQTILSCISTGKHTFSTDSIDLLAKHHAANLNIF